MEASSQATLLRRAAAPSYDCRHRRGRSIVDWREVSAVRVHGRLIEECSEGEQLVALCHDDWCSSLKRRFRRPANEVRCRSASTLFYRSIQSCRYNKAFDALDRFQRKVPFKTLKEGAEALATRERKADGNVLTFLPLCLFRASVSRGTRLTPRRLLPRCDQQSSGRGGAK